MNEALVVATVKEATKGANINLAWHRPCKTKTSCEDVISKAVTAVGRVGIDYNNMKAVQEKRENGDLPETPQAIWYGKGEFEIFPYLIRHTVTNQKYLRLYNGTGTAKPTRQFYRNGVKCSFESVEMDLLASEKKSDHGDCFCCKIENMTSITWDSTPPKVNRQPVKEAVEETETVTA